MVYPAKIPLMIVEDDANLRFLFSVAAQRSGLFEPITVLSDGLAAIETLRASDAGNLPALVVSDLCMPRMTGLELVRSMKADARLSDIPVAIVTSSDSPNDRELSLAAGACIFIPKPYGIEAISQTLVSIRTTCVEAAKAEKATSIRSDG